MEKLVLGITGHRDLYEEDKDPLFQAVVSVFRDLQSRYEVILLTSLAEGADMLCINAAKELKIRYYVILPRNLESYALEFGEKERKNLYDLVNGAVGNVVAPAKTDNLYFNASYYMVCACDVLLALWNGEVLPDKAGGTSSTVSIANEKKKKIIRIVTRRKSSRFLEGKRFEIMK